MIGCPIDYYIDNIIFNSDKSCWAAFSLNGYDYDFLSIDDKIKMLYRTARFLSGITTEAQILIIPIQQNLQEHFETRRKSINTGDPLYKQALNHNNITEEYLLQTVKAKGATNDYKTYIIVKLPENQADIASLTMNAIKEKYQFFIKNPMNAIDVWMNLDTKDILSSRIDLCIKLALRWFTEQNLRIGMQKCDVDELQWLFRRMAYRGLTKGVKLFYGSQDKKQKWQPKADIIDRETDKIVKPLKRDIANLFSGAIKTRNRVVMVDNGESISYQTFLVITNIPDEMEHPGSEWIYMSQKYDSQAEICIHIKAVEHRTGLKKLDYKNREINSQIEHIESARADVPEELLISKEYATILESELKEFRAPILHTSIAICLAADDPDLLDNKVTLIKNAYEDSTFAIERPLTDQRKLFMQFIPSVGITVKDYVMSLTPKLLAGGVIGATHELGDNIGPYIGTTGMEEKHVFLEMGLACLKNKSASATFFGNLGVGKSFNANLLIVLNVIYGGYGLIFDPKGERSHWVDELKVLQGMITLVSLSPDPKYKGMLDPFNVYKDDINLACELALNVVSELFKIDPKSNDYIALLEAVRIIKTKKDVRYSMTIFAEILDSFNESDYLFENARNMARKLRLQQENGMSQLLVGDGTEESIKIENRLNIIQIENLRLPNPDAKKVDYSSEETLSTVIMMVLSHFAKKFALVKRPVFKEILFDESWALGKTVEGAKLYDYLARMGRSLYTGCIFNGHSVLDIPSEGIKNTITYKFCFQTQNNKEADRMLEYLGLEITEENRNTIKFLGNGECLFQDLNGHVGILKFDAVFEDIIEVFKTTPTTDIEETIKKDDEIVSFEEEKLLEELDIDIYTKEEI